MVVRRNDGPLKTKMFLQPDEINFLAASEPPLTLSEVIDGIFSSKM